ncbi:putative membrane protein [Peptoniphilus sp. ING2-D1G]|nr:putative membrane protein [Peptoniphilus sp. ING2-D1G]
MWTRKFLKDNAKEFLRKYLKDAIIVCLIFFLLSSIFGDDTSYTNLSLDLKDNYTENYEIETQKKFRIDVFENSKLFKYSKNFLGDNVIINDPWDNSITLLVSPMLFMFLAVVFALISIFVIGPMSIGLKRYFIRGYHYDSNISYLFSPFKDGTWKSLAGKLFLKDIYIFLWTLLLIVPGIIKTYEYYFVPYILAEDPELSLGDAIAISKELTRNDKFNIFVLELSFFGWIFLSAILLNLGFILLNPYMEATTASLYIVKKKIVSEEYENVSFSYE